MKRTPAVVRGILPIAVFAVTALFFYWPALVGGEILLPLDNLWTMLPWVGPPGAVPHNRLISDLVLQNYPWKVILDQAVRQRVLPLWNPYVMGGLPYLGTAQTGVLYPFTLLFVLLGPLKAYGWFCAFHQFLAASLTYRFARRLEVGRFGSTVAGLVFAFSFFLTVSYIWPMVLGAAIWLPLGLWSLTGLARAAEKRDFGRSLVLDLPIGALAIALSVLGGHVEITFYSTFAIALYGAYLAGSLWLRGQKGPSGRFLLAASLTVSLGVAIAAVQLVPFLDLLRANNRQGDTTYAQVISYALPERHVLALLMPDFFGNPATHSYFDVTTLKTVPIEKNALGEGTDNPFWGIKNYVEAGGYVGVLPLILAILGGLLARRRERWFFIGLAALSLLLAFGSPLYALIYYGLPFFSQLRTPFRWLYLFDFAIAVLAGLGADRIRRGDQSRADNSTPVAPDLTAALIQDAGLVARWLPAAIGVAGLATLAATLSVRSRSVAFASRILERTPELQRAFANGAMLYSYEMRNLAIFFALLAFGGILVGLALRRDVAHGLTLWNRIRVKDVVAVLIVATIVADLLYAGRRFASEAPASILTNKLDLSSAMPTSLAGPRAVSYGDPEVLPANLGVLLGVPTIGGYDTIIASNFVRLWSLVEPPVDLPYNKIGRLHQESSLGSPILDLLNVRYVLTTSALSNPAVRLIGTSGPIRIYERPAALPRAFIVGQAHWAPNDDAVRQEVGAPGFQPARVVVFTGGARMPDGGNGTAEIQMYGFDRVTVRATLDGSGWLVLADSNAPGWNASVDGVATPVLTADGYLRAVHLTSGTHLVVFSYSPLSLEIGAYLSFLAAIVLALTASLPLWRRAIGHYAGQAERVLRNATLPMFTSFLNKAIDFGFAILMVRVLGPGGIGEYTVAIALMGYFEIFTSFGLNTLIVREVSRNRATSGRYLANALALRLGLLAVAAPIVAGVILFAHVWFNLGNPGVVAFALLTLSLIPGNVSAALSALFNAWERLEVPATITVATTLARVALGTAALLLGAGIVGLAAVSLALNVALVVVFVVATRRILQIKLVGPIPADLPAMLVESAPLFVNQLLVTIFFKIDVVLLQAMKGSETVGYYSTAYKWLDGFLIIPATFTFAVFPALSRFAEQKGEGLRAAYDASLRVLVSLAIPIAMAVAFLSGDLILLLGGEAYYPQSSQILAILIWFLPFSYINGLTQYALVAVNRQRFITIAFFIAAAFNLGANLLLIPRYGFYATSVVTVLSEIVLMVPFLIAVRESIGFPHWRNVVGKPALAGLVMLVAVQAGSLIELHLALLIGLALYGVVMWRLEVFSTEEIAVFRRLIQRPKPVTPSPAML